MEAGGGGLEDCLDTEPAHCRTTHSLLILEPPDTQSHQSQQSVQLNTVEMEASEVDWETINDQLPYDHSEESHARRREIWNGMNVNGNKFLSLAEVDKGIIDVRNV